MEVKIWKKDDDSYAVQACGEYAEFQTQIDAARFADECLMKETERKEEN